MLLGAPGLTTMNKRTLLGMMAQTKLHRLSHNQVCFVIVGKPPQLFDSSAKLLLGM